MKRLGGNAPSVMHRKSKPGRTGAKSKPHSSPNTLRLYELEVFLIGGPVTAKFAKKNRVVSRSILIRGDQTLADLHHAIFEAFGRWEEHFYEFQFGKGPMDPGGLRYVLPSAFKVQSGDNRPPAGRVDLTTIESLRLKVDGRFGYWFDFGDDWWHQINVEKLLTTPSGGKYPTIIKRQGENPPQYPPEG
jgi:Plasmid pRiA4b ORF-3-like protein